ncbi:SDR family oxidoreductase [Echinicola marina]|uniref:SDR family NAD(P)-dependent oxidoreductase n=1 Tax=Echinicola marina TaxID=2859768 RepID=UPI001CF66540|nr:SDR family NAD(P)-dependent oxidoreductase [Echinicola marina]UCS94806.1 SDR family oxidoreductase [Echinicola marina]
MLNYVIIGASSGIGKVLVKRFLKKGNHVWASYQQHQPIAFNGVNGFYLDVREDDWETEELTGELESGIRGNCFAASLTDAPLGSFLFSSEEKWEASARSHARRRIDKVEDIMSMAALLLSDKSRVRSVGGFCR